MAATLLPSLIGSAACAARPQIRRAALLTVSNSKQGLFQQPQQQHSYCMRSVRSRGFAMASPSSSSQTATAKPTISVGEKLPEAELSYFDESGAIQSIKVSDLTRQKKVVIFAVPGAFTPTCSQKHVPGFIEKADELKAKGVDTVACVSVNDAFVMKAWGDNLGTAGKILLLADGNGSFTRQLGVTLDLSDKVEGLGVRSRRYALLADDGVVKVLNLEEGGAFTVSSAEEILKAL